MERIEAVKIFFEDVRKAYIEDQKAKDIRASGRSAESLRIELSPAYRLYGSSYIHFQKVGRKPGGFPPIEAIIEWLKEKKTFRIDDERGPGLRGLAFLIARKIAKKGTDIFLKKRPALSIEEKIAEFKKDLVKNLTTVEKEKIKEAIQKIKKVTAVILLLFMTSCSPSITINGYKVKDVSGKSATTKDRNIIHISFWAGYAFADHFTNDNIK